ncbi:MAG TPA: DUF6527 family protein [Ignavibacteriales bacterium]|nr:DUF6527 family protein [Ignavibacteriales bacterium]
MKNILRELDGRPGAYMFFCPGCKHGHVVYTDPQHPQASNGAHWGFNGNLEKPTFSPSILVSWNEGENYTPKRCHSFVTDGKIQFLTDSTHELAGKTVALEEF